jgi:hypothetical protein
MINSALGCTQLLPVAARFKTQVWSRLTSGIVGSNPADGTDVRLLCLCVVKVAASVTGWSLAQRSPTGDARLCDIKTSKTGGPGPMWAAVPHRKESPTHCVSVVTASRYGVLLKCLYNIFHGIRKKWKLGHISKPPSALFNGHSDSLRSWVALFTGISL